ncbi:splicing regulator SDE2-like [Palaemon carinicauda]|uniref:splicing regulator SDE2-like n=1 Tax=Palaemon carinicauda TaxID=392227 RepID=UPI0035B63D31
MVIITSYISGSRRTWCINGVVTTKDILEALVEREGNANEVVLQSSGHILTHESSLCGDTSVVATLRLLGGKGGFGSMLRAIGAQIEKTTNREACRDLSGRRLRDINEEKRLKDFISKKSEREREMQERKRQKFEKLKETPRHIFQDESYYQQREIREKNLFDSIDKAIKNGSSTSGVKRSCDEGAAPIKRIKQNKFLDDLDESSDESEDECSDSSEKNGSNESEENVKKSGSESEENDVEKEEGNRTSTETTSPSTNGFQNSSNEKKTGDNNNEEAPSSAENNFEAKVEHSG